MAEGRKKIVKIASVIVTATILYAWVSSPGVVVVDQFGRVDGLLNKVRAELQGSSFWMDQAKIVQKELDWELGEPERWAQLDKELDREMEELYRQAPSARPTPAEQRADALRARADAIEMAELTRSLEEDRLERISKLQKIKIRIDSVLSSVSEK